MDKDKLLEEARERFAHCVDADREDRTEALEDLRFLAGDQWPQAIKTDRESDGRPCLTINKLPAFLDQIVGDARQNKPAIKVRPVDSQADPELADVLSGIIRNIEYASSADTAYDTALEQAASCGRGYFRILYDYAGDDVFEKELRIKRIVNPFTVYLDPDCEEADFSDARFAFVSEMLDRKEFERRYPGKAPAEMPEGAGELTDWNGPEKVRIAEYWRKEPVTRSLRMYADESRARTLVLDASELTPEIEARLAAEGLTVVQEREAECHKVVWYKIAGSGVLEGPVEWPGKHIPIVRVSGKEINVEGKTTYRGVVRFARDPQRMYNYWSSVATEVVALAPKAPWLATPEQIQNYEEMWRQANTKSLPYLLYNNDGSGAPQRQPMTQVPAGMIQQTMQASDDMKATTGIYDASLGAKSNETSGRAIVARQREGDTATFAYIDNLARAIRFAGKILVDLIPQIYDTDRIVRVRGVDDKEDFVRINYVSQRQNPETGMVEEVIANDLTAGRYDVTVEVGPSYSTQRQEAAESMVQFVQAMPQTAAVVADLIAKNMDWPGAEEIADRLKKMLPPGLAEDGEEQAPPPPPAPDPMQELEMQAKQLENEKTAVEIRKLAAEAGMIPGLEDVVGHLVQQQLAALLAPPQEVQQAPMMDMPMDMQGESFAPPQPMDDGGMY